MENRRLRDIRKLTGASDRRRIVAAFALSLVVWTPAVSGHHSNVEYDRDTVVEFEGETVSVLWRNPHVTVEVATTDESGETVVWSLEGAAVSSQRRRGVTDGLIAVGDRVRVAGFPSTRRPEHMLVEHLLLPDGVELLLGSTREPRWSEREVGSSEWTVDPARASTDQASGILRVWTRGRVRPWYFREAEEFELTEWAAAHAAEFDPFEDNPLLDCTPPGMPALMGNPYPMEFVETDRDIELRFEEFDVVRMIHMDEADGGHDVAASPLGHSVGRWEGDTLVVATNRINWPHFGRVGIPQSESVEVVERFTVVDEEDRLDYELTITDPEVFAGSFTWEAHYNWRPGEVVGRYECTVEG